LADLLRIVDGRRRPDLTGRQVDAPASAYRVAFEDAGQLIQIHRKWAKIRDHTASQQRLELIGQNVVALPAPFPERGDHTGRGLCTAVRVLLKRGQHPVTEGHSPARQDPSSP
jgi:hypothetical protein